MYKGRRHLIVFARSVKLDLILCRALKGLTHSSDSGENLQLHSTFEDIVKRRHVICLLDTDILNG
jgi:hypothetical protein